jgi:hypothetical protein
LPSSEPEPISLKDNEDVKPVTEKIHDVPMPTGNYFKMPTHNDTKNEEVNIFDSNTTTTTESNTHSIYSTPSHMNSWVSENLTSSQIDQHENVHDMSPFLPDVDNKGYSVTENISETNSHIQSPFLPDDNEMISEHLDHQDKEEHQHKEESLPVLPLSVTSTTTAATIELTSATQNDNSNDMHTSTTLPPPKRTTSTSIRVLEHAKSMKHSNSSDSESNESDESDIVTAPNQSTIFSTTEASSKISSESTTQTISTTTETLTMLEISTLPSDTTERSELNEESTTVKEEVNSSTEKEVEGAVKDNSTNQEEKTTISPTTSSASNIEFKPSNNETTTEAKQISTESTTLESSSVSATTEKSSTTKKLNHEETIEEFLNSKDILDSDNNIDFGNEFKVLPLTKQPKTTDPPHDPTSKDKSGNENELEHTTGHFLSETTFRLINSTKSNETSLNIGSNIETKEKQDYIDSLIKTVEDHSQQLLDFIYSKCSAGQFQCVKGTSIKDVSQCINLSARCDSFQDCSDNSDEADECQLNSCYDHFQCSDGQCLARQFVCDGISQCSDGSDEVCNDWQCKFDEFSCNLNSTGQCLPSTLRCDGKRHCSNGADENECEDACKADEFYCPVSKQCISSKWMCDEERDCVMGEDENICSCSEDQFKCKSGGCISKDQVCDGQSQCLDSSDEYECLHFKDTNLEIKRYYNNHFENFKVCNTNWTNALSNRICQILGFTGMTTWKINPDTKDEHYLSLTNDGNVTYSIYNNLKVIDSNECSEGTVQIKCEEFGMFFILF